jgi:hypothetical protein
MAIPAAVGIAIAKDSTAVTAGNAARDYSTVNIVTAAEGSTAGAKNCIIVATEDDSKVTITNSETDLDQISFRYDRFAERIALIYRYKL